MLLAYVFAKRLLQTMMKEIDELFRFVLACAQTCMTAELDEQRERETDVVESANKQETHLQTVTRTTFIGCHSRDMHDGETCSLPLHSSHLSRQTGANVHMPIDPNEHFRVELVRHEVVSDAVGTVESDVVDGQWLLVGFRLEAAVGNGQPEFPSQASLILHVHVPEKLGRPIGASIASCQRCRHIAQVVDFESCRPLVDIERCSSFVAQQSIHLPARVR